MGGKLKPQEAHCTRLYGPDTLREFEGITRFGRPIQVSASPDLPFKTDNKRRN